MLRLEAIELRIHTTDGPYGFFIKFDSGLVVIKAHNTRGKSTTLQSILYALGIEKMFGPKRDVPLPYVATTQLKTTTGISLDVLESSVRLQVNNGTRSITIRRVIKGKADRKLVNVWSGPLLTDPAGKYTQRDYFLFDAGSASREDGFHWMLANFLGWKLPQVRRNDGSDALLYLECIFPLVYVEQKSGWSVIPANFPWYLSIREMGRRAVEFLLKLDAYEIETARQRIAQSASLLDRDWDLRLLELQRLAQRFGGKIEGVPDKPDLTWNRDTATIVIADGEKWTPAEDYLKGLRGRLAELLQNDIPTAEKLNTAVQDELEKVTKSLTEIEAASHAVLNELGLERSQHHSIDVRVRAITEDLTKHKDAKKLAALGSSLGLAISAEECPTCHQVLPETFIPSASEHQPMSVDDNIKFLTDQQDMLLRLRSQSTANIKDLEARLSKINEQVKAHQDRIRVLKATLVAPGNSPAASAIQERLVLDARIRTLESTIEDLNAHTGQLELLRQQHETILKEKSLLPAAGTSESDKQKLSKLAELFREQCRDYGFSTFDWREIDISDATYKPTKQDFEIGFEVSASDGIRLKWAYQMALLELARSADTNHPGLLIFDEPRQQDTEHVSLKSLLLRAATAKKYGQQVILATSDDSDELPKYLNEISEKQYSYFEGYIVEKLKE